MKNNAKNRTFPLSNLLTRLSYFLLILFLVPTAQAGRALVFMKNRESFQGAQLPVKIQKHLKNLNVFIVEAQDDQQLQAIKNLPGVAYVEKEFNHPVKLENIAIEKAEKPWGLDAIKAPRAWEIAGKGKGIRVLVLDTGIDPQHPSLKDNFEKGRDFTGASKGTFFFDETGHGTHVAGTVAAIENSSGFAGVAPEATILAGRVCGEMGCNSIGVIEGIDWGVSEKVDVINLSLGSTGASPATLEAVLRADRAGVSIVAATGNYGVNEVLFPAAYPSVIAVGAVDRHMQIAKFSQYGPEVTLVAPGVEIVSTYPRAKGSPFFETFGTSMASPHVAGVVALVRSANKKLTPLEIKELLIKTAIPLSPNIDNKFGAGLVNAEAAVSEALRLTK